MTDTSRFKRLEKGWIKKVGTAKRNIRAFWRHSLLPTQLGINASFVFLILLFYISNNLFWENTQVPRLKQAAETQAQILAESQSASLTEILQRASFARSELENAMKQMLIVEDPAIGERFIKHLKLELDEAYLEGDVLQQGEDCVDCFQTEVLLTDRDGNILGLASYAISGAYFKTLVKEMQPKLFAESSLILIMVLVVWFCVLFLFYRLQLAKRQIEASDQAKTRFMANVTHELKTPLNAILGYTQLHKKDENLPANLRQGMETIDDSAAHLLMMINDILEYSRANKEDLKLHPEEIDMKSFLHSLVEMIRVRAKINDIKFDYEFSDMLPATIVADEKRLKQILLNLLGNAVKFTREGSIHFSVMTRPTSLGNGEALVFTVKDTGIGIDKKEMERIFLPFQQIDNPINRAEGSGLGLSISQNLLAQMGSKLRVKSVYGQGSEFSFVLNTAATGSGKLLDNEEQTLETPEIVFPDPEIISELIAQLKRQNILGVREVISNLEDHGEYSAFLDYIQPFIKHYRFKQLLDWLENSMP